MQTYYVSHSYKDFSCYSRLEFFQSNRNNTGQSIQFNQSCLIAKTFRRYAPETTIRVILSGARNGCVGLFWKKQKMIEDATNLP